MCYVLALRILPEVPGVDLDPYPPDSPGASHASLDLRVAGSNPGRLAIPGYRTRHNTPVLAPIWRRSFVTELKVRSACNIAPTNDVYNLTQFRMGVSTYNQRSWFKIVAVTQDSRVFFNQHVPNAAFLREHMGSPRGLRQNRRWRFRLDYRRRVGRRDPQLRRRTSHRAIGLARTWVERLILPAWTFTPKGVQRSRVRCIRDHRKGRSHGSSHTREQPIRHICEPEQADSSRDD